MIIFFKQDNYIKNIERKVIGISLAGILASSLCGCLPCGTPEESTLPQTSVQSYGETGISRVDITTPITSETIIEATTQTEIPETTQTKPEYTVENRGGIYYIGDLILANKSYPLPSDYNPGKILPQAQIAFEEMKTAASHDGIKLSIVSGFRTYSRQNTLYTNYVASDGKANADRYSARPGHSEHQTGLAMDLNSVEDSFADTPEAKWIEMNCAKFGFIVRYPREKEEITGYIYEPWHVRFVGVELAEKIMSSGLCLEEYFGIKSVYADN